MFITVPLRGFFKPDVALTLNTADKDFQPAKATRTMAFEMQAGLKFGDLCSVEPDGINLSEKHSSQACNGCWIFLEFIPLGESRFFSLITYSGL